MQITDDLVSLKGRYNILYESHAACVSLDYKLDFIYFLTMTTVSCYFTSHTHSDTDQSSVSQYSKTHALLKLRVDELKQISPNTPF